MKIYTWEIQKNEDGSWNGYLKGDVDCINSFEEFCQIIQEAQERGKNE